MEAQQDRRQAPGSFPLTRGFGACCLPRPATPPPVVVHFARRLKFRVVAAVEPAGPDPGALRLRTELRGKETMALQESEGPRGFSLSPGALSRPGLPPRPRGGTRRREARQKGTSSMDLGAHPDCSCSRSGSQGRAAGLRQWPVGVLPPHSKISWPPLEGRTNDEAVPEREARGRLAPRNPRYQEHPSERTTGLEPATLTLAR
jgi:hypothetical protein